MLFARLTHLSAPGQPFSAIKSCNVVPTVAPGIVGNGHSKLLKNLDLKPTRTNRGRSCGTPKSDAFSICHSVL